MAAGTRYGEAEYTACQGIDAIVPLVSDGFRFFDILRIVNRTQCEKSKGSQVLMLAISRGQVGSELVEEKLVVGKVGVEGVHNPVSIKVTTGIFASLKSVCLIFTISGDIKPMSPPSFTVCG